MNRHSVPCLPAKCGALHGTRDEMRAHGVGWYLQANARFEGRARHDVRWYQLDVVADVEDKVLGSTAAPLFAVVDLRRHVLRVGRLRSQSCSGDLRVVERTRLCLFDNRRRNASELLVPSFPLSNMVVSVQGLLDEVGKLGVTLLKLVRDECPRQAVVERRRKLRALRFAQTLPVELRAAIRPDQVLVTVELFGDLTLVGNRGQELVQVATTDAAGFDRP